MKKMILLLLVVSLLMLGCEKQPLSVDDGALAYLNGLVGRTSTYSVTEEFRYASLNEFGEQHYVELKQEKTAEEYADDIMKAYPSGRYSLLYHNADKVVMFPVVGLFFQQTDLVHYVFYEGNMAVAYAEVTLLPSGEVDLANQPTIYTDYMEGINRLDETYPNAEILAMVRDSVVIPSYVVRLADDPTLKQYQNDPRSFRHVSAFTTLEEGRALMAEYLSKMQLHYESLPVFPWKSDVNMRRYMPGSFEWTEDPEIDEILQAYEDMQIIPLLTGDLEEEIYALCLLYYHGDLAAEIVIRKDLSKTDSSGWANNHKIVWKRVASKDENGKYIPLEMSSYQKVIQDAQACDESWIGLGVVYNGEFLPVGHVDGNLKYYDSAAKKLLSLD